MVISESASDGFAFMLEPSIRGQIDFLRERYEFTIIAPFALPLPRSKANIRIIKKIFRIKKEVIVNGAVIYQPCFFRLPLIFGIINDYLRLLAIIICIKINKIKFDIIHAHYAHPPGFVSVILSKITKNPVIISCHGSDIHEYTESSYPDKRRRQRVLYAIKNADCLIAVSNFLKEKIINLGIEDAKIKVVPNGVKKEIFYPINMTAAREKLKLPIDKKVILNIGILTPIKGTINLINAFAELIKKENDFLLIIIGDGPLRSDLEVKAQTLNIANHIRFLGYLPGDELIYWFNAANLFVLPSLGEGFGMVLIESLSCGIPVVASNVGGIPEIINKEDMGILVPPGDAIKLADGLLQALNKKWDSKRLIDRARYYSWENVARLTSNIYERMF